MATRRQMYAEQTRSDLLDSARRHFTTTGYNSVTVDDIVSSIEVSKGTFYYHFSDKQAMFTALLTECLTETADTVTTGIRLLDKPGANGPQVAATSAWVYLSRSLHDRTYRELMRQAPMVLGEETYRHIDETIVLPPLVTLMDTLAARGELKAGVHTHMAARMLMTMFVTANSIIAESNDPATTMTEVADTIATMFSGIVLGDVPLSRAAANG
ncbi:Putative TetR-family transcriptional regulator [Mycobacteroides abscessus subsp. massiliense]|uniref:TetR family transcriptional regulator n=8 Tax=Mycobacteroides abscessus TaxID=36809 RepID=A0A1T9WIP2_9MYCO|nr:TetR family transcriptional regulator [Mycobacteroides abscessus subsp. bolletii 50594]ARQ66697.1 TetR family transcriptional regulator [Mycobacteroides abscessus subsp. massiliense]AWG56771.1 TetR/AcrR family transcriptional regulator [Mycobacteroides abscessus]TKV37543.1 TetR family transcriptional regulator [Mycobacteroides abscessus subsp. bolletii]AWG61573.1 TetR/AcrR family transcriptional regulator [Mycobacteroides abscessus]